MKKIVYIAVATGKYSIFIQNLIDSGLKFFFPNEICEFIIFTDDEYFLSLNINRVKFIKQKKIGFPFDTLNRYELINSISNQLDYDYIFFGNINMVFNDFISVDILPNEQYDFCAVEHPGYFGKNKNDFPYERNQQSLAYVKNGEEIDNYYQCCFYGGEKKAFLKMSKIIDNNIKIDLKNNIIATWWDESHTNKYFIKNKPKLLHCGYAYPEDPVYHYLNFDKKIIQLDKKNNGGHEFLRNNI